MIHVGLKATLFQVCIMVVLSFQRDKSGFGNGTELSHFIRLGMPCQVS